MFLEVICCPLVILPLLALFYGSHHISNRSQKYFDWEQKEKKSTTYILHWVYKKCKMSTLENVYHKRKNQNIYTPFEKNSKTSKIPLYSGFICNSYIAIFAICILKLLHMRLLFRNDMLLLDKIHPLRNDSKFSIVLEYDVVFCLSLFILCSFVYIGKK